MEQPIGSAYSLTSGALLRIARDNCEQSRTREGESIVSLVFSAFYVEAVTNELLHKVTSLSPEDLEDEPGVRRVRLIARAAGLEGRTALATKLQCISVGLRDEPFDMGSPPFQDLDLLVLLRHSIVHNKPEELKLGPRSPGDPSFPQTELAKLLERLIRRGVVPAPNRFVLTPLFMALMTRRVAVWAINAAVTVAEILAQSMPSQYWHDAVFLNHDFTREV